MAKRIFNTLFIFGLALFALIYLMPRSAEALDAPQPNSENPAQSKDIPFLNRFKLHDSMDSAGFDEEEKQAIYRSYKGGRSGDEEYAKYYSPTEKLLAGQSWKRLSYAVYDRPGKELHIDVNPRHRAVMLNYSLKLEKLKLGMLGW